MNKPWFWPRARLLRLPRLWLHRMPMPDICEDSTGTTDTLGCAFREGPMRTPCSLRTPRLRAPTIIRACQTFSFSVPKRCRPPSTLSIDPPTIPGLLGVSCPLLASHLWKTHLVETYFVSHVTDS